MAQSTPRCTTSSSLRTGQPLHRFFPFRTLGERHLNGLSRKARGFARPIQLASSTWNRRRPPWQGVCRGKHSQARDDDRWRRRSSSTAVHVNILPCRDPGTHPSQHHRRSSWSEFYGTRCRANFSISGDLDLAAPQAGNGSGLGRAGGISARPGGR